MTNGHYVEIDPYFNLEQEISGEWTLIMESRSGYGKPYIIKESGYREDYNVRVNEEGLPVGKYRVVKQTKNPDIPVAYCYFTVK